MTSPLYTLRSGAVVPCQIKSYGGDGERVCVEYDDGTQELVRDADVYRRPEQCARAARRLRLTARARAQLRAALRRARFDDLLARVVLHAEVVRRADEIAEIEAPPSFSGPLDAEVARIEEGVR